ncbi:hypothetical protein ACFW5D_31995 [Streptomyces sp. NPDC058770]|uniref:hypothetical protein n=1 Tax=Streptomyces sp. NPDC058770 TaxID=3346631 RepID=UPI0036D17330
MRGEAADRYDLVGMDPRLVARLSPFVHHRINIFGRCSFALPELPGGLRLLRDKDAAEG